MSAPFMSRAEHYREAERLIVRGHDMADQGFQERANFIIARAQVHATLASVHSTVASEAGVLP